MGKLYDYCTQINQHIESNSLDVFRTRGALAIKCGFIITLIGEDDPDDVQKITSLREAAHDVLGLTLN